MVRNAARRPFVTALFVIAVRRGYWRVTLNGLFFGDYRSAGLAKDAISEAQKVFAPRRQEARQNDHDPSAAC